MAQIDRFSWFKNNAFIGEDNMEIVAHSLDDDLFIDYLDFDVPFLLPLATISQLSTSNFGQTRVHSFFGKH